MKAIFQAFPDPETLLALEPEEFGELIVLGLLSEAQDKVHPSGLLEGFFGAAGSAYSNQFRGRMSQAIVEAWSWLESQGLLVLPGVSGDSGGWRQVSSRARSLNSKKKFADYRVSRMLPADLLHETIRDRVRGAFLRGEYDTAVFQAMKELEIAVRRASRLPPKLIGVSLARAAFHIESGPLTDLETEVAERQARMELFSGALGSYKNPLSHRHVQLDDPVEAIEQVILASHLLRIVDSSERKSNA